MMMFSSSTGTLFALLTLSVAFCNVDGITNAEPDVIYPGLTKELTVNCTVPDLKLYDITPVRLLASRRSNTSQTFEDVASVNDKPGSVVTTLVNETLNATGYLSDDETPFLNLVWNNPTASQAGVYRCRLFGTKKNGDTETKDGIAEVAFAPSKLEVVGSPTEQVLQLQQKIRNLTHFYNDVERRIDKVARALFYIGKTFNGSRHYLSRKGVIHAIYQAEVLCELFGGYLAEIDNRREYEVVQDLIKMHSYMPFDGVFLGGTDRGHEGHFVYRHSGKPMSFTDWYPGQPDNYGEGQECFGLSRNLSWRMDDQYCWGG